MKDIQYSLHIHWSPETDILVFEVNKQDWVGKGEGLQSSKVYEVQ